jgi:hypothetical protein
MRALAVLAFALPPLYLILLLTCLLWSVDEPALAAAYPDQQPRMIASDMRKATQRVRTPDGGREGWKAFVLFPSVLSEPKVVTVRRLPDGAILLTESRTEFWVHAAFTLISLAAIGGFVWKVATHPSTTPRWTDADRKRDQAMRDAR